MSTIQSIRIDLALGVEAMKASAVSAVQMLNNIQSAVSKINLQGAIKGDPFSGVLRSLGTFNKELDKVFVSLTDGIAGKFEKAGSDYIQRISDIRRDISKAEASIKASKDTREAILKESGTTASGKQRIPTGKAKEDYDAARNNIKLQKEEIEKYTRALKNLESLSIKSSFDKLGSSLNKIFDSNKFKQIDFRNLIKPLADVERQVESAAEATDAYLSLLSDKVDYAAQGNSAKIYKSVIANEMDPAIEAARAEMIEKQAIAAEALSEAYRKVWSESKKLAEFKPAELSIDQKARLAAEAAVVYAQDLDKVKVAQEQLVQTMKLGINLLENEKLLRKSIVDLAMKGVPPEQEALDVLLNSAPIIAKLKTEYQHLENLKKSALTNTGGRSLFLEKEALDAQRKLMASVQMTDKEFSKLSISERELKLETMGFGLSFDSLSVKIKETENEIRILRTALLTPGMENMTEDTKMLTSKLLVLDKTLADLYVRRAQATAIQSKDWFISPSLNAGITSAKASTVEGARDAAITAQARVESDKYLGQTTTIEKLREEYTLLERTKEDLARRGGSAIGIEEQYTKILAAECAVVLKLAQAGESLDANQAKLYVRTKYGITTIDELKTRLEMVNKELKILQGTDNNNVPVAYEAGGTPPKAKEEVEAELSMERLSLERRLAETTLAEKEAAHLLTEEERQNLLAKIARLKQEERANSLIRERSEIENRQAMMRKKLDTSLYVQVTELRRLLGLKEIEIRDEQSLNVALNNTALALQKIKKEHLEDEQVQRRLASIKEDIYEANALGFKNPSNQYKYTDAELGFVEPATRAADKAAAAQRKEAGLFAFDSKRIAWFGALRVYWALYTEVMNALTNTVQFEQEMANVAAVSGSTKGEMASLTDTVLGLGTEFMFSSSEIAKGLVIIAQAGFSVKEASELIRAAVVLASGTMSDMSASANLLTTIIRAWNYDTKDSIKIADTLTGALNQSKLSMDGLVTSFNYVTGVAPELNMSLEETLAALSIMSNAGLNASISATSLRAMLSSIIDPNDRFAESLSKVGLTIADVDPQINNFGDILVKLKKSGFDAASSFEGLERRAATGIALMVRNADQYDTVTKSMYSFGAAEERAAINLDTLNARWKLLINTLSASVSETGGGINSLLKLTTDLTKELIVIIDNGLKPVSDAANDAGEAIGFMWEFAQSLLPSTKAALDHKKAVEGLRTELTESQHALTDTTMKLDRLTQSYDNFNKVNISTKFRELSADSLVTDVNNVTAALEALSVAQKEKVSSISEQELNSRRASLDAIKGELELYESSQLSNKRVRDLKESIKKIDVDIKNVIKDTNEQYQAQIVLLTIAQSKQQERIMRISADLNQENFTNFQKAYESMGDTKIFSTATKEFDKLRNLSTSLQAVMSSMTVEQKESFIGAAAKRLGIDAKKLEAEIEATDRIASRFDDLKVKYKNVAATGSREQKAALGLIGAHDKAFIETKALAEAIDLETKSTLDAMDRQSLAIIQHSAFTTKQTVDQMNEDGIAIVKEGSSVILGMAVSASDRNVLIAATKAREGIKELGNSAIDEIDKQANLIPGVTGEIADAFSRSVQLNTKSVVSSNKKTLKEIGKELMDSLPSDPSDYSDATNATMVALLDSLKKTCDSMGWEFSATLEKMLGEEVARAMIKVAEKTNFKQILDGLDKKIKAQVEKRQLAANASVVDPFTSFEAIMANRGEGNVPYKNLLATRESYRKELQIKNASPLSTEGKKQADTLRENILQLDVSLANATKDMSDVIKNMLGQTKNINTRANVAAATVASLEDISGTELKVPTDKLGLGIIGDLVANIEKEGSTRNKNRLKEYLKKYVTDSVQGAKINDAIDQLFRDFEAKKASAEKKRTGTPTEEKFLKEKLKRIEIEQKLAKITEKSINSNILATEQAIALNKELVKAIDVQIASEKKDMLAKGEKVKDIDSYIDSLIAQGELENKIGAEYGKSNSILSKQIKQAKEIKELEEKRLKLIELIPEYQNIVIEYNNNILNSYEKIIEEAYVKQKLDEKENIALEKRYKLAEKLYWISQVPGDQGGRFGESARDELDRIKDETKDLERNITTLRKLRSDQEKELEDVQNSERQIFENSFNNKFSDKSYKELVSTYDQIRKSLADSISSGDNEATAFELSNIRKIKKEREADLAIVEVELSLAVKSGKSSAERLALQQKETALKKESTFLAELITIASDSTKSSEQKRTAILDKIKGYTSSIADDYEKIVENAEKVVRKEASWSNGMKLFNTALKDGLDNFKTWHLYLEDIGAYLGSLPGKFTESMGTAMADWSMMTFFGQDTEDMKNLKSSYEDLAKQRADIKDQIDEANRTNTSIDPEVYQNYEKISQQMEKVHRLMEKEKSLLMQVAKAWKQFVDAVIQALMKYIAEALVAIVVSKILASFGLGFSTGGVTSGSVNPTGSTLSQYASGEKLLPGIGGFTGFATGGVIPGGLSPFIESFSSGGVTSSTKLAMIGDNPSKQEIVLPAEKIKANSTEGYVRDKASESQNITIVNTLSPNDIAAAISQETGQKVIINTIGNDILKKGPTYRMIKSLGAK